MPSDKRITQSFVRVDTHNRESIHSFIAKNDIEATRWVVFHKGENGDNPHFHALWIHKNPVSIQTLKNRVKKHFKVEKAQFAVVEWDGDEKINGYAYHEKDAVFIVNNLTEKEQSDAKLLNQEVQQAIVKKQNKKLKPNHWEIIESVRQDVLNKDHEDSWKIMMKALEENKIRTNLADLERWYMSIKRCDDDFSKELRNAILKRIYR